MTALQAFVGGIGNEDRWSRRGTLVPGIRGNCFAQPRLNEASQAGGTAFLRQGIDDMLEEIGTQAPAYIARLHAQFMSGSNRVLKEMHLFSIVKAVANEASISDGIRRLTQMEGYQSVMTRKPSMESADYADARRWRTGRAN